MTSSDSDRRPPPGGLVWFDEPAPPRRTEQLSRERIVRAAMDMADQEASGEFTMRALATGLGVRSPMALYRYVGSKDGLLDLMADQVYGQFAVARGEGWREALRTMGRTGWDAVRRHPWFARLAFSRPPLGPNALDLYEAALTELDPLGLDAAIRSRCVDTVLGQVFSSGLALLEERTMRARTGLSTDDDLEQAAAPYMERIAAAGRHPHFVRWATDPERHAPGPQPFDQTLEWLLDGLARIVAEGGRTPGA
ncbi:TetR/AcrR family transcriptional regulator C-terminal domain-containing protein [Streptomyces varsoviensis]|uniref:TetR/AcrR family transcriptional regulator n=1 Tax=Streptomyces varsoviensis TaxID=67373 RepID=UPI0033F345C4